MTPEKALKTAAGVLIAYLFINLTLYVLGRINHLTFWGSLLMVFLLTKFIIPKIRKKISN